MTIRVLPRLCAAREEPVGNLQLDRSVTGTLDEADCILDGGRFADAWEFHVTSESNLQIDLTSSDFDALLVVADESGAWIAVDDDGGEGLNSRLVRTFQPGGYLVFATSYRAGARGAYVLSVATPPPPPCATPVGRVAVDGTVSESLQTGDCRLEHGGYAHAWEFQLGTSSSVQIDLTSSDFDTFLFLTDVSGAWLAADDDGGEGLNSRIVTTLAAGQYLVWATSYSPGELGNYQLSLRPISSASAARIERTSNSLLAARSRSGGAASAQKPAIDGLRPHRFQPTGVPPGKQ